MKKILYSREQHLLQDMLVSARQAANLTQENLGEVLRKPQSFVSKYERGERLLNPIELLIILRVLGVSPGEFFRELDEALGPIDETN